MTHPRIQVAALVGSLRQNSMNRALMRTAMLLAPEHVHIYEVAIDRLPFGAIRLDASGVVRFYSRAEARLSGYGTRKVGVGPHRPSKKVGAAKSSAPRDACRFGPGFLSP